MRTIFRVALWSLAGVATLAAGAYMYLRNADLSVYEEQIEDYLSDAIGHSLDVDGLFELSFGNLTRITAEKITVSNTAWQADPMIMSVGHFSITVDLWSLVFGPVIVEDLDIRNIHVRLERNAELQANWESGSASGASAQKGKFNPEMIAFKEVRVKDVQF